MDTSQNSSLSQITQKVTAITLCSLDNCLSAKRIWRRPNTLRYFEVSLQRVSMCPTESYTDVTLHPLQKLKFYDHLRSLHAVSAVNYQILCNEFAWVALTINIKDL